MAPCIAVIDDDHDQAESLCIYINNYFHRNRINYEAIIQYPFSNIEDYFSFIGNNNIVALIIDERLDDQITPQNVIVDYKGNDLAIYLRERLKEFPIFSVTGFADDSDLLANESKFDLVIPRGEFRSDNDSENKYIARIIRTTQRYLNNNEDILNEFHELTIKVSSGEASENDKKRLEAIKIMLELPLSTFDDRLAWLNEYQKQVAKLEAIKEKILKNKL